MPRSVQADALFDGSLSPAAARTFVRQSGARFLLFSCSSAHQPLKVQRELRPVTQSIKHFGCATVYELDPPAPAQGPLAELPPNAAVRASRRK